MVIVDHGHSDGHCDGHKESVIVSPVIIDHSLRRKGEIKTVSVLTRLPSSLVL